MPCLVSGSNAGEILAECVLIDCNLIVLSKIHVSGEILSV